MIKSEDIEKIFSQKFPGYYIRGVKDMGKFYLIFKAPYSVSPNDFVASGKVFDALDKLTGNFSEYDITSNPTLYRNAKDVEIKTLMDTPISNIK